MANKRVSELAPITSTQLVVGDLLLLSDIVAQESKKLSLQDFSSWLFNGSLNPTSVTLSGSLFGTSSWARFSQTASVVTNPSASYALTASFALNSTNVSTVSASWASQSLSSSYAVTASFVNLSLATSASFATNATNAKSASFVIFTGGDNGTVYNSVLATNSTNSLFSTIATTAITATSSLNATSAVSASWASQSLSSSHADVADFALSASFGITTNFQSSASWASQSLSSSNANTASLAFTASHLAPSATLYPQGIFLAITQSTVVGQLDVVQISPEIASSVTTSIEAMGTVIAFYTSSVILNESLGLFVLDRTTGNVTQLDSTPVYVNLQGQFGSISASIVSAVASGSINGNISGSIVGNITGSISGSATGSISGSLTGGFTGSISGSDANGTITGSLTSSINASITASITSSIAGTITSSIVATYTGLFSGSVSGSISTALSGAIKIPFSLMGSTPMTGSYLVYVSASSNKINLEPTRITRFNVDSAIGNFVVTVGDPVQFTSVPTNTEFSFSSTDGGPFVDTPANIVTTGSNKILSMSLSDAVVSSIKYVWTLPNLTSFTTDNSFALSFISGMPNAIVTMSFQNCALKGLSPLTTTSASILKVNGNSLIALPSLPSTMSFIDVSANAGFTTFPTMPSGLKTLNANLTAIATPPSNLPNSLVSMSFNNNPNLVIWLTTLPSSLTSFDVNNSALTQLPTIPGPVLFLDVSTNQFGSIAIDNICAQLVSNGLNSGSLNLSANPGPILNPTTTNRIATLTSRGWIVTT